MFRSIYRPACLARPTQLWRKSRLEQLQDNWDNEGAARPTPAALHQAVRVLSTVLTYLEETCGDPRIPDAVVALPDGGIEFDWEGPRGELDVEITPRGETVVLHVDRSAHSPVRQVRRGLNTREIASLAASTLMADLAQR
jgi:hypothetical protein